MNYIVTCNENSKQHLIDELEYYKIEGTLTWFNETDALLATPLNLEALHDLALDTPLLFLRHYFQIDGTVSLDKAASWVDVLDVSNAVFSIQMRSPLEQRKHYTSMRNGWVDALIAKGNTLDVRNPETIVSVYITTETLYYGVSHVDDLLSKWSAGEIHFSKKIESISRAEFKLLEVFDAYPIQHLGDVAVDLGAAPGGWSKVLHDLNYEVYAIDPANLDPKVSNLAGVNPVKMTAQEFVATNPYFECDLIVNDMKMHPEASLAILSDLIPSLSEDGLIIFTAKLSKFYGFKDALRILDTCRSDFNIRFARQLFHNRHEFTLILQPKESLNAQ